MSREGDIRIVLDAVPVEVWDAADTAKVELNRLYATGTGPVTILSLTWIVFVCLWSRNFDWRNIGRYLPSKGIFNFSAGIKTNGYVDCRYILKSTKCSPFCVFTKIKEVVPTVPADRMQYLFNGIAWHLLTYGIIARYHFSF